MNLGSIDSWQLDEDAETVATPEKVGGTVYVNNKPLSSGISVLSVNGDGTLPVITAEPKGLGKFVEIKNAESVMIPRLLRYTMKAENHSGNM